MTVDIALTILAGVSALGLLASCADFAIGHRSLRSLKDIAPAPAGPRVSLIAAARNEARGIEQSLTSILRLDYPDLEIIIVNDRSTDETGAILERMARHHPQLRVMAVTELPDGWLGKNHALFVGASNATGELLLFTDADIIFDPTTLRRAVTLMEQRHLDHLTALPDARVPGVALSAFVAAFGVFFTLYSRPWKARDPRSRSHIGVGAFNFIRTTTYRAIGTHQAIAMRPDDDLKLGKLVKKNGFRQDVVYGRGFVVVEWYATLRELIDGLMKNAFAGVNYSLLAVAGSTLALVVLNVWPFVAVVATTGITRILNLLCVMLIVLMFGISARYNGVRLVYVVAYPLACLLFAYIIWRSALVAVFSGTITWRGTAYPLAQMRANRV